MAVLILTFIFVEGSFAVFWKIVAVVIFFGCPIFLNLTFIGGGEKANRVAFFTWGAGTVLGTAFLFLIFGTTAVPRLALVTEPLLCPSGYETMESRQTALEHYEGTYYGFKLTCKGEKGYHEPSYITYGVI
ncbi:MAG: hypothetical protein V3S64_03130, partial [bacterium]